MQLPPASSAAFFPPAYLSMVATLRWHTPYEPGINLHDTVRKYLADHNRRFIFKKGQMLTCSTYLTKEQLYTNLVTNERWFVFQKYFPKLSENQVLLKIFVFNYFVWKQETYYRWSFSSRFWKTYPILLVWIWLAQCSQQSKPASETNKRYN